MKLDTTSEAVIHFLMKEEMYAYDYINGLPEELALQGITEDQFLASCRYLKRKGYCEDAFDQRNNVCGIALTHEMIHRKEFRWINVREFLFHSVAVPIVVSAVTSAVIGFGGLCWAHLTSGSNTMMQNVPATNIETSPETITEITSHLGS